jgi:biotin carboxyl carrier protein
MTDHEVRVGGVRVEPATGWLITWVDRSVGIARITSPDGRSRLVVVEGHDQAWWVTIEGRRIGVEVRTWRERVLAEAETLATTVDGPAIVTATLPGLIVAVSVSAGDEVEEGASLLTIEAMKMQNEVRAPRAGRVAEVSVAPGEAVATGVILLRLE